MPFDDRLRDAFLAVATHGSIGRAAEVLNVSQPTLSRMIKRLEQKLDVPLFDRYASGVTLTVFGEALFPFADRIGLETDHARAEIERLRSGTHGVLRIGSAVSPGVTVLPRIFERLHSANPHVQIEFMEAIDDALEVALLDRKIDLVVAGVMEHNDEIMRLNHRFDDTGSVIASMTHPVRERGALTMADLHDVPWVMPPRGTMPRRRFEEVIGELGVQPHIAVETRSVMMMKALVADCHFLSWLPRQHYVVEESAGLIGPLEVAGMYVERHAYIFRRRHGSVPPVVHRFLEIVRKMEQ
ncbi:MAG TPA: LysR family transcriptional regulator [Sphingomonadaceae bacterium]|nr:LysR family transcriptional regulator [Sphingomonadaceae bacterium]